MSLRSPTEDGNHTSIHSSSDRLVRWLIRFRWIFVIPVLLPASIVLRGFGLARALYLRGWRNTPRDHERRVQRVQEQIAGWRENGAVGLLCTARKNWMSVSTRRKPYKQRQNPVRLDLYNVLEVDTSRQIVRTEPQVSIGELTRRLVPLGWTLPVVPELDNLTVGGLIMGYGIESSSHKYGLFSDLVQSYEVVLGDGKVVCATRKKNSDLFYALPWSHGALGFLAAVDLRIIPCTPCVRLTYHPFHSLERVCEFFTQEVCKANPADFIEGILFSRERGVIMTGDFVTGPEVEVKNEIGWWFKPWFYKHCQSFLERGKGTECIPIRQYYHRHTRSIFWEGELIVPYGNRPLYRFFLGWMMPPEIALLKLTQGSLIQKYYEEKHVAQDVLVPIRYLEKTVAFFHETFECYPVWLCPHRNYHNGGLVRAGSVPYEMFVDVGAWYVPGRVLRDQPYDGRKAVRKMEAFAREHRGVQCPYAITEMTREEYRDMFDCTLYDRARKKYGAEGVFMDAYDKVKRPGH